MDRRKKDTLRAGATAVGVATGLLVLASTAQTPDGYIHASFGGPLDVLSAFTSENTTTSTTDVLAIGDGSNDASELAALLKGQIGPAAQGVVPNSPYRVAYEAGAAPGAAVTGPVVLPPVTLDPAATTAAPTRKDAAILPSKPVIDSQGKIDCTGAVSCHTDPVTNITTVTFPDGIVAIVQKVNDLTVVAYKTITDALPAEISALLPPVPTTAPRHCWPPWHLRPRCRPSCRPRRSSPRRRRSRRHRQPRPLSRPSIRVPRHPASTSTPPEAARRSA